MYLYQCERGLKQCASVEPLNVC